MTKRNIHKNILHNHDNGYTKWQGKKCKIHLGINVAVYHKLLSCSHKNNEGVKKVKKKKKTKKKPPNKGKC